MIKLYLQISIIILTLTQIIYAQNIRTGMEPDFIYQSCYTKIGTDVWAKGGAYVATINNSAFAYNNPALGRIKGIHFNTEFGKKFTAKDNIGNEWDNQFVIPSYASISIPYNNIIYSIGYSSFYNRKLTTPIPETTAANPDGTGYFEYVELKLNIHSFFISGNYIFSKSSIGILVALNYLNKKDEFLDLTAKESGFGPLITLGASFSPTKLMTLGVAFKYFGSIKCELNNTNIDNIKLPYSFDLGMNYNFSKNVILCGMLNLKGWESAKEYLNNEIQYHLGAEVLLPQSSNKIYFGFFNQNEPVSEYYSFRNFKNQKFLTAGIKFPLNPFILSLGIMDSHLFFNDEIEERFGEDSKQFNQTYISMGFHLNLN